MLEAHALPPLLQGLAALGVTVFGVFLLGLGGVALLAPARARAFLLGFVGTPAKHALELALRLLAGAAFVLQAPLTLWPAGFAGFGAVLLLSTAVLALLPWRWHQRFAQCSVPAALRFLPLIGLASLCLGAAVLVAGGLLRALGHG